ncbi:hypothetical protein BDV33DRAFT_206167 [Aspergillus novoparasiticus]|uniref:Uncharacterized protein n=1 Tax=Aspergillus novoparasiticus TaxID=986946 RepID=A0A5N6EKA4_9EURO|nr:hypothetical protein BDV33DRAFT_206167 [Aspergillus novoparasiticus]
MGFNHMGSVLRNVLKKNAIGEVVPIKGTPRKQLRGASVKPVDITYFHEVPADAEEIKEWAIQDRFNYAVQDAIRRRGDQYDAFLTQEIYTQAIFMKDRLDSLLDDELFEWSVRNIADERDYMTVQSLEGKHAEQVLSPTLTDKNFRG